MTNLLFLVGAVALLVYLGLLATKAALSRRYAAAHPEVERAEGAVTVLQAILSGDPFLETALRRNLECGARFLWLVDEDDAEARRLTALLLSDYPGQAEVLVCPAITGNINPKTAKLQLGLEAVQTEFIAVLDDDTILADDNLGKALHCLTECDLYTGLPCYLQGPNLWSALVAHFVNNNSIMTYLPLLNVFGPLSLNGMFYVMRTQKLRALGGFTPILRRLCDDYALARLVKEQGGIIRQGITSQLLRTTLFGPGQYVALMRRWFIFANLLVRDQKPVVSGILGVLLGLPPLLLWLSVLTLFGGWIGLALLAAGLLARHLSLRGLQRAIFGVHAAELGFSWSLSLVSELLQPWHWLHAALSNTFTWRTRRIRLERDGSFSYIDRQYP